MSFHGYGIIVVDQFGPHAGALVEGQCIDTAPNGYSTVRYEFSGDNRPPEFGPVGEVLQTVPGIDVEVNEAGVVKITADGRPLAHGLDTEDMNLTEMAEVMDAVEGCDVFRATEQYAWSEGDVGGGSALWSKRYQMRCDTSDLLDEALDIDEALRAGDTAQAAGIVCAGAKEKINNIKDQFQRKMVAEAAASEMVGYNDNMVTTETD